LSPVGLSARLVDEHFVEMHDLTKALRLHAPGLGYVRVTIRASGRAGGR
jgi:hypothetical protein